jgi:hypothetical protein
VIVNRALPQATYGADVVVPPVPVVLPRALQQRLRHAFEDLQDVAARQAATLRPLLAIVRAPILAEVPLLSIAPASLAELAALGRHLFSDPGDGLEAARGHGGA